MPDHESECGARLKRKNPNSGLKVTRLGQIDSQGDQTSSGEKKRTKFGMNMPRVKLE